MDNHLLQALLSSYSRQLLVESESGSSSRLRSFSRHLHLHSGKLSPSHRPRMHRRTASIVSPSHLSRLFRQQGHMRLADYISWVRLERAKFMLKKYRFRLEEVANPLRFYSDVNYFCRVFKQKTGLTPSQYRSLSQPQNGRASELERDKNGGETGARAGMQW